MKKGFTIIEVSILFVIFLIVAFLVAPLSLDDTMQARNISRWKSVQADFINISHSITSQIEQDEVDFYEAFKSTLDSEIKNGITAYKISSMNGVRFPKEYIFKDFKITYSNSVLAYKFFDKPKDNKLGLLMYDVNGIKGPNTWGKDVFGLYIGEEKFIPFGAELNLSNQKQSC